jgi:hypothetical protein
MADSLDELFPDEPQYSPQESFDGHVITVVLPKGEGEYPTLKIECKSVGIDNSPCQEIECVLEQLYKDVGWELIRAAGDIELGKLSARVDWTDPEEPWIDVEP